MTSKDVDECESGYLRQLEEDGYVVIKLEGINELVEEVNLQIEELVEGGKYRTNSKIYSYNNSPRIVESWRHSSAAHRLAFQPAIIRILEMFFRASVLPFSTINFLRSTEQPLHSDYVHFGTVPEFNLAAAWIALEDIDPRSGPVRVVPRSHKLPEFRYEDLGLPVARSMGEVKSFYTRYEEWLIDDLEQRGLVSVCPELSRGDVIIWLANLVHGSPNCENSQLSRKSQVIHYHPVNTSIYYNPVFSVPSAKKFVNRAVEFIPHP